MTSPSTAHPKATRRRRDRIRRLLAAQLFLWDRTLSSLQPWQEEGPLRWRGGTLDGQHLAADRPTTPSSTGVA